MSEFLAEAKVLITPDTTRFRADLEKALIAATRQVSAIKVPIAAEVASANLAGATAAIAGLSAAQETLQKTTLGLTTDEAALTRAFGAQATILPAVTTETAALAGAQKTLDAATTGAAKGLGQAEKGLVASLASLTGLRGAVLAASTPFLVTAVAVTAFSKSVSAFSEFEKSLNVFRFTARATADEMEQVRAEALALGQDLTLPAVSATDAAQALTELSRAGLTVEDALAGARGVLQLSTAAQISVGDAAKIAANELNAFGLAGDQATHVADVLANAANAAQGEISDFGLAFAQSSAVARQVGLTLEDTAAQLTVLARAGLRGSDAGTSLRVALLRLINPTKDAAAVIRNLGIQVRDAQGNIRPDVFVQFGEATANLAPKMRDAAFATVFGADAIRTVSIEARAGRAALADAATEIGRQGTAADLAKAQTEGFAGQTQALSSDLNTAAIALGKVSALLGGPIVSGLDQATRGFITLLKPVDALVDSLGRLKTLVTGPSFDPLTASAADFLDEIAKTRAEMEQVSGPGADDLQEAFGIKLTQQIKTAIAALKAQRAELKALGLDTGPVNEIIGQLRRQLDGLKTPAERAAAALTPLEKELAKTRDLIESASALGLDTSALQASAEQMQHTIALLNAGFQSTGAPIRDFSTDLGHLGDDARNAAGGIDTLTSSLKKLGTQSAQSQAELLRLQTEGGTPAQQIAVLQSDIQTQRDIIEAAKARGGTGSATAIKKAREQILRDQSEIDSIQSQIESDAKAAAREAKDKADKIAKAQEDATKAFISAFDPEHQRRLNAITAAGLTEGLSDDLRFEQQLVKFLKAEIDSIKRRIKRLKLHGDALKAARAAIVQINQEIFNLTQDIARDQAEQQQRTQDILEQKEEFRIRIAQARDNVPAEIKARRARLARITAELVKLKNAGKKNTLAWLELKAQQAEEAAAIKELEGETKKKDTTATSFFNFLQTQAGFAANLLGNLIPGFATSGLVGGTVGAQGAAAAGGIGQLPREQASGLTGPLSAATATASARDRGVRPVQVDTTNQLLRQILRVLQNTNGRLGHPEARYQDHAQRAAFDGVHGN